MTLFKRGVDDEASEEWQQRQFRGISDQEKEVMLRNYLSRMSGEGSLEGKIAGQEFGLKGQAWFVIAVLGMVLFGLFAAGIVYYVRDGNKAHADNLRSVRRQLRFDEAQKRYEHALIAYRMSRAECLNSFELKERTNIRVDRKRGIDRLEIECPWIGTEPKPPHVVVNGNGNGNGIH